MRILITGGTGYLGRHLAKRISQYGHDVAVFSRSEAKQAKMKELLPNISYYIGDVRGYDDCLDVIKRFGNVDIVIHAAALKRIDSCEENPVIAVDTNINGSINILKACDAGGVKKAVLISTDKAYHPHTLYGGTKYVSEGIFRFWNGPTKGIVLRYGNVIGSTGSVFAIWESQYSKDRTITVRNKTMTRFFWGIERAVDFVIKSITDTTDKNLFIPKIKALNIYEMAKYIYPKAKIVFKKSPYNEKIHENMVDHQCSSNSVCAPKFHYCLNGYLQRR